MLLDTTGVADALLLIASSFNAELRLDFITCDNRFVRFLDDVLNELVALTDFFNLFQFGLRCIFVGAVSLIEIDVEGGSSTLTSPVLLGVYDTCFIKRAMLFFNDFSSSLIWLNSSILIFAGVPRIGLL